MLTVTNIVHWGKVIHNDLQMKRAMRLAMKSSELKLNHTSITEEYNEINPVELTDEETDIIVNLPK